MANVLGQLVGSVLELGDKFAVVATTDLLSALLTVVGTLLIVFSVAVVGYLTLGAVVDLVTPDSLGRTPRRLE